MSNGSVIEMAVIRTDGMDECARAEEEQGLEHGVGEEVEHGCHVADAVVELGTGNSQRHHHKRNLRYGGECEHSLDINLRTCYHGSIEGSDGAYHCYNLQ